MSQFGGEARPFPPRVGISFVEDGRAASQRVAGTGLACLAVAPSFRRLLSSHLDQRLCARQWRLRHRAATGQSRCSRVRRRGPAPSMFCDPAQDRQIPSSRGRSLCEPRPLLRPQFSLCQHAKMAPLLTTAVPSDLCYSSSRLAEQRRDFVIWAVVPAIQV